MNHLRFPKERKEGTGFLDNFLRQESLSVQLNVNMNVGLQNCSKIRHIECECSQREMQIEEGQ